MEHITQIVIAILGLIIPGATLYKDWPAKHSDATAPTSTSPTFPSRSGGLELAIVLAVAAFFSIVLSDALAISGRTPTLRSTVPWVVVVTSITTAVLVIAWRIRSVLAAGVFCAFALLVLMLAPGGAFFFSSAASEGEPALNVLFPALVIVALAATLVIYTHDLRTRGSRARRWAAPVSVMAFSALGIWASGRQLARSVEDDPEAPTLSAPVLNLFNEVMKQSRPQDRVEFYRLASEVHLADEYRSAFLQSVETRIDAAQKEALEIDFGHFSSRPHEQQMEFLEKRARRVHAAGDGEAERAPVSLPGTSAITRYSNIGHLRRFVFGLSSARARLFRSSPPMVGEEERQIAYGIDYSGFWWDETGADPRRVRELLDPEGLGDAALSEQLALPNEFEKRLAFREYARAAIDVRKDRVRSFLRRLEGASSAFVGLASAVDPAKALKRMETLSQIAQVTSCAEILDASSVRTSDPLAMEWLAAHVQGLEGLTGDDPVAELGQKYRRLLTDAETRQQFASLLRDVPMASELLSRDSLLLARQFTTELDAAQRDETLRTLANPVAPVIEQLATRGGTDVNCGKMLKAFAGLKAPQREALLKLMAMTFYRPGGHYSLDPVALLLLQGYAHYGLLGASALAALIVAPLFLLSLSAGFLIARKLTARDRIREALQENGALTSNFEAPPSPHAAATVGRDRVIDRLRALASRGWSTIGLVGRRGVGKSRVLSALLTKGLTGRPAHVQQHIGVWISAPTRFSEQEFVESVLDRLASSTERRLATCLGAQPIHVRVREQNETWSGVGFFIGVVVIVLIAFSITHERVHRPEVLIAWIPPCLLLVAGTACAAWHLAHLQPVDLTRWLERDRSFGVHAVLLYRETLEVLRRVGPGGDGYATSARHFDALRGFANRILLAAVAACALAAIVASGSSNRGAFTVLTVVFGLGYVATSHRRTRTDVRPERTLMSVIAAYRGYAQTVVFRLRKGALGSPNTDGKLIICIDELDKIVDPEETRAFVRRVKPIFEVEGVYYFLSMAEDTFHELYLSGPAGKTEIDSSFDHIVTLEPLTLEESKTVAASYLQASRHSGEPATPDLVLCALATIALGIPRDILRHCDELLAAGPATEGASAQARALVRRVRVRTATFAHDSGLLSHGAFEDATRDEPSAVADLMKERASSEGAVDGRAVAATLWWYALVETTLSRPDPERKCGTLMVLGFSLGTKTLAVTETLSAIHTGLFDPDDAAHLAGGA